MKLRFTYKATRQPRDIKRYIADRNATSAREIISRIRASAERLWAWPQAGRTGHRMTRELVVLSRQM
ncbi:type II toxin-antitoxin system RelE/ParE family toxin [Alsobacter soli]|uniref:type II toxin-antitoxin system RelE/ParE family toxin n=1 Tax=Alsobacter soli TaxID=2109933 RepID=UPI001304D8FA